MNITCDCGETFQPEITGSHSVGRDEPHTHVRCPSCGTEWTVQPRTGRFYKLAAEDDD